MTKDTKSDKIPIDMNGISFSYPRVDLPKREYAEFMQAVNNRYHKRYSGKPLCEYDNGLKVYFFENHGYSDYNIYDVGESFDD